MKDKSKKLGYKTQLISNITGNLDQVTQIIAFKAITSKNNCIIFGGEPTVNVIGNGKGGRNQELVLRLYEKLKHKKPDFTFASIGTDGIDGNTKFAGSIFSTKHNYDGRSYLNNNDSSSFLVNFVPQKTPSGYPSTALPETADRPPSRMDSTPLRSSTLFL